MSGSPSSTSDGDSTLQADIFPHLLGTTFNAVAREREDCFICEIRLISFVPHPWKNGSPEVFQLQNLRDDLQGGEQPENTSIRVHSKVSAVWKISCHGTYSWRVFRKHLD